MNHCYASFYAPGTSDSILCDVLCAMQYQYSCIHCTWVKVLFLVGCFQRFICLFSWISFHTTESIASIKTFRHRYDRKTRYRCSCNGFNAMKTIKSNICMYTKCFSFFSLGFFGGIMFLHKIHFIILIASADLIFVADP